MFQPKPAALKLVIDAFKKAPVQNPDGATGINIHIDAGPNSIMNGVNNARWNARSRAASVPHQPSIVPFAAGSYNFTDLDNIKGVHFNATRRAPVFHYALFADRYGLGDGTGGTSSGLSRKIPGGDFIVSLGSVAGGTVFRQAGTFMHELGHNLGLRHGGDENAPALKPNHLSVMNYRFQFIGLLKANGGREFDYSRRKLNDLDETALNEAVGIMDPDNHRTLWGPLFAPCAQQLPLPATDWNCDGMLTPPPLMWDITGDGFTHIPLHGFNEWPALSFQGGGRIGTGAARGEVSVEEGALSEPSIAQIENSVPQDLLLQGDCSIEENVTLSPETGGTLPHTVTFDATASTAPCSEIITYFWDFGDGEVGSGSTAMHPYTSQGTFVARLSMTDKSGNTNLVPLDHVVQIPCSMSISPTNQEFPGSGGSGGINVTAPSGCDWTVLNNSAWILITSELTGSGNGVVKFELRQNLRLGSRQGSVAVAGNTYSVTQRGNCSFSISPQLQSFTSAGGTGNVAVSVSANCDWTATSNDAWITIISGSGVGNGTLTYSVPQNTGPTRVGTVTVAGRTLTVKQKPG